MQAPRENPFGRLYKLSSLALVGSGKRDSSPRQSKGSGGSSALTAQRHDLQRFTTQLRGISHTIGG